MKKKQNNLQIQRWIQDKGLKTNKGNPIEFKNFSFLWDYLSDPHNRIVLKKCTQVGASFTTLLKLLYHGDHDNISTIYTLPTSGDVKDFVLSKFDPVIRSSSYLQEQVQKDPLSRRKIYSTVLKRIGGSHFFFRGSWTEHAAQMIDADVLVVDELDFQKPEIRKMYEERLEGVHSKDMIYWLGVPTLPRSGISDLYDQSDQRKWHIRCPHCKKVQTLSWPDSISKQKRSYVCKKCRKDLPDSARRKGKWIPTNKESSIHGYHLSRLMAPWISADKILNTYDRNTAKNFYNYTLGEPYLEKTQQLTSDDFKQNLVTEHTLASFTKEKLICGIDQGSRFHIVLGYANKNGMITTSAKIAEDTDRLEQFLDTVKPNFFVMDMFPDQHYAKKLQKKYGKNIFILSNQRTYADTKMLQEAISFDKRSGILNLDRTEGLDQLFEKLRNSAVGMVDSMSNLRMVQEHLRNLVPDYQTRFGRQKKVYQKIGQDDFAHALNYFQLGCGLCFPEAMFQPATIVPSVRSDEVSRSHDDWIKDHFEKKIQQVSGDSGVVVIRPKEL